MKDNLLSTDQAAKKLFISANRVRQLCKGHKFEGAYKIGRQWHIPLSAVEKYREGFITETKIGKADRGTLEPPLGFDQARRLIGICQTEFAKLTLTSLLCPFATDSDPWAIYIYHQEIRHHLGHSPIVARVASTIKNASEFSQLKGMFPDREIWSLFDQWENDADALVDAFQQWYTNMWSSVKRGVLACYGEPPRSYDDVLKYLTELVDMMSQGNLSGAVGGYLKVLDRPKFQRFETVRLACAMLESGIQELTPDPYWAYELDKLGDIKAIADSNTPPIPKDFASQMDVGEFPGQVDETKHLVAIADKLRQTQALIIKGLQQLAPV